MTFNRTLKLDNRSTKISVSNFDEASKDGLKEHFEVQNMSPLD